MNRDDLLMNPENISPIATGNFLNVHHLGNWCITHNSTYLNDLSFGNLGRM
jgi:hypothetical protein